MQKIRGDESTGVKIHIYMETPQGNSLCNYFYLKQEKNVFFFSFFLFSSTKSENRRAE
jgi:hypothetical protein